MNKEHNNDISPEELLRQLKASIELDNIEEPEKIEMPDIDNAVDGLSPEELFKRGASRRSASESGEDDTKTDSDEAKAAAESKNDDADNISEIEMDEPDSNVDSENEVSEEAAPDITSEDFEAAKGADDKTPTEEITRIATQEFNSIEDQSPDNDEITTAEFDALSDDDDIGDVDVDALMKKYLSEAEYNEVLATRRNSADEDLAAHISEAEEYVSSIENEIEKQGPAEPVTEIQKTLQEMDLSKVGDDSFDETDVNLMIAFGMKDELEEKLGDENIQMVKEALDKDAEAFGQIKREDNVPNEIGKDIEFVSSSQIREVFDIYKKQYRNILMKVFGAVFMLVAVFFFENFEALGGTFPVWLEPQVFPVIHSMVSLQLLLLAAALVVRPILDGIKAFFCGKPTQDSLLSFMVMLSIAYHVALCFTYDGSKMLFCNVPVVLFILLTIISRMLDLKSEIYSFNIVSSKRVKHIIAKIPEERSVMEHEAFDEYIDENDSVFRVSNASFVDGFFQRTRKYDPGKRVLMAIIPICVVISVFFLLYGGFANGNWNLGLRYSYISLILSMPLSAFVTFAYPYYRAQKISFEMGSAIIGESSLDEYSDAAAVSFDDKDVFPSAKTKVKSIKIYGNNRIDRIIYNTASLFKVLGGPLRDVFNIATKDFECSDDVEIVDITDDGIEAVISGKHIFYGKASYLHKNNFEPIYDVDDERIEFTGEACIAYLVCNDEVAAKLYVSYGIDPDFISIAKQLYRAGMCIGIKSFDPNIDSSLLSKHINLSKYAVKVLKCRTLTEKTETEDRADSGIVSKKNAKSLLKTLALCEKVNSVTKVSLVIKVLSILLAFGITVFTMFKGADSFKFAGLYAALYQLFWMVPILGISALNVKK